MLAESIVIAKSSSTEPSVHVKKDILVIPTSSVLEIIIPMMMMVMIILVMMMIMILAETLLVDNFLLALLLMMEIFDVNACRVTLDSLHCVIQNANQIMTVHLLMLVSMTDVNIHAKELVD